MAISEEELIELMLVPLITNGADKEVFFLPNWGIDDELMEE